MENGVDLLGKPLHAEDGRRHGLQRLKNFKSSALSKAMLENPTKSKHPRL